MIDIRCGPPTTYSTGEIKQFCRIVNEAGEVISQGLESRVRSAEQLVTAWSGEEMIGVGAIKRPLLQLLSL